jgi:hypothetical protein
VLQNRLLWKLAGTASLAVLTAGFLLGCAISHPNSTGPASEVFATTDLADAAKVLGKQRGLRTLVVLDIDDTLLTSAVFFGSDAWYEWQRTLAPGAPGYVPCRFDVLAMNYESGTQVVTQPDAVGIVNALQADKIILTARSELYRGATIRELKRAGYSLPKPLTVTSNGVSYDWQSDPQAPAVFVNYRDGVFMVSGQNKGILLLELLRRLDLSYERVILVDDGERNIEAMRGALASAGIAYVGMHYTRVDKAVNAQQVHAGIAGWQSWQRLLAEIYPERLQRFDQRACAY